MKYISKSTASGALYTGHWLGPRDGLDRSGKTRPSPPIGLRSPDRPARRQALHKVRYPGTRCQTQNSLKSVTITWNCRCSEQTLLTETQSNFTNHHTSNKCTNCMSFILNYFFKILSLLLHVSIAYRLSSSGSTYSSLRKSRVKNMNFFSL